MVRYEMANGITRVAFRVGIFELLFVQWIVILVMPASFFEGRSFGERLLIVAATATKINLAIGASKLAFENDSLPYTSQHPIQTNVCCKYFLLLLPLERKYKF
jgi:hypothetical protein